MTTAEGLLAAVRGGDLDACAVLADHLSEQGDPRGDRLRRRWRRWKAARDKLRGEEEGWLREVTAHLEALAGGVRCHGGVVSYQLQVLCQGEHDHQDRLLLAYVERLVGEAGNGR